MKCRSLLSLFSLCCVAVAALSACASAPEAAETQNAQEAQEWTRFRGPNGEGQSDAATFPAAWTTADYLWRVKLPGIGHSSPVVRGDRLFVTAGLDDATRIVRCLRTSDGGLIWKRDFPAAVHRMHAFNTFAVSTPAVDDRNVYLLWADPEQYVVLALDQERGREQWRRDLGPFVAEHGFGASPIRFEDLLIVPNDQDGPSFCIALDAKTGETRWKTDRPSGRAAYSTPFIHRPEGGEPQLVLASTAAGLSGLDPRTGRVLWRLGGVFDQRVVGSPVAAGDLIIAYCGTGGSGTRLVAVRPGDAEGKTPPEIAYEIKGSLPYVCMPLVHGELLFLWHDQGVVTCVEAATGEIHWRERIGGRFFGSPVRVGERLYCMSRDGEMVVLAADKQFKLLGRVGLEEASCATPAVAGGVMYLRTVSHLMALAGSTRRALY
jgi:outer membrane protein assembly factor BamB